MDFTLTQTSGKITENRMDAKEYIKDRMLDLYDTDGLWSKPHSGGEDITDDVLEWIEEYARQKCEEQKDLIEAQKHYIKLLEEELNEVVPMASHLGWETTRYLEGEEARSKIKEIENAPNAVDK